MAWSHSGVVFSNSELSALNINVSYSPESGEVLVGHNLLSWDEIPLRINVSEGVSGVLFSAATLSGSFPPDFVKYYDNGAVLSADDFDELPDNKELVHYSADNTVQKTYMATVQSTVTVDSVVEYRQTTVQFVIFQDWSAGKSKLQEYMINGSVVT